MNNSDFYINEQTGSSALIVFSDLWKTSVSVSFFVIIAIILIGYYFSYSNTREFLLDKSSKYNKVDKFDVF